MKVTSLAEANEWVVIAHGAGPTIGPSTGR
jgi:hypothetical protein